MLILPLKKDIETKEILKKSIKANSALSKLNGVAKIIPNQMILINALTLQEAKDSETAIIYFDLVLGYGAHPDPLSEILPVLKEARKIAPDICFVCPVIGTEKDPQNRENIVQVLEENNIIVMPTNASASELVKKIIQKINR